MLLTVVYGVILAHGIIAIWQFFMQFLSGCITKLVIKLKLKRFNRKNKNKEVNK